MIVIGTEVVENYLANHAGHKGTKAAQSQYEAWLDIVGRAQWRNLDEVKASYPRVGIEIWRMLVPVGRAETSVDSQSSVRSVSRSTAPSIRLDSRVILL
jgi:hypothetical protein